MTHNKRTARTAGRKRHSVRAFALSDRPYATLPRVPIEIIPLEEIHDLVAAEHDARSAAKPGNHVKAK